MGDKQLAQAFTADWFSRNIQHWEPIISPRRGRDVKVLEIGSFEGLSAVFLLESLPQAHITCIDCFMPWNEWSMGYEERFDTNTAPFGTRIRKIKSLSVPALNTLWHAGDRFDLIYIDGDHGREAVFFDSILAWPLLKVGGILIWDDYAFERETLPSEARPEHAIDLFLLAFAPCLIERHREFQVIIEKTAEWPLPTANAARQAVRWSPAWQALGRHLRPPRRIRNAIWSALEAARMRIGL